jgi:isoleucyl-tRNA synthetase
MLHRLFEMDGKVRAASDSFDLHGINTELHNFCANDLSAFYFDIRKDALYCDAPASPRRRAVRSVLRELLSHLTAWLAPVLCFTAEEAWAHRPWQGDEESVHLRVYPAVPAAWQDAALAAKWDKTRDLRRAVTGALEIERAEKRIGSSLQAHPVVHATGEHVAALHGLDLAEIAITSAATLVAGPVPEGAFTLPDLPDVGVLVTAAEGEKCERCWRVLPDVGRHGHLDGVCGRCADAVAESGVAVGTAAAS